jgi:hypothetical protein
MHSPLIKLLAKVAYGLTIRLVDPWPNVGINSGYFINITYIIIYIIIHIITYYNIYNNIYVINVIFTLLMLIIY